MDPVIRDATVEDVLCLTELIRESFADVALRLGLSPENCPTHPSNCQPEWVRADFARSNRYWIVEQDGQPCGCVALEQKGPDEFRLRRLAVLPACRRRGLGAALVRHALAEAAKRGARTVELGTLADDKELQQWYSKLGFAYKNTARFEHLPFAVAFMVWQAGEN